MHKYQKNNTIIVVFVAFLLILSAAAMYFAYFYEKPVIKEEKEKLYEKVTDSIVIKELENIIKNNNLLLLANDSEVVDDTNNITMQTKINLAYYSVKDKIEDIYENGINVEEMENYFKNAFTQTIYWDKSSIYCTCGEELFIFDVEKNKYNYNTNHLPHNTINILPYYTNITEVTKRNDTYIVKVNNVWSSVTETYGYTLNGYPTYKDALNNTNELFNLTDYDDTINDYNYYAIKEIEDNYDTYKDKLKTYTYTFMKKDNNYYLTSFK